MARDNSGIIFIINSIATINCLTIHLMEPHKPTRSVYKGVLLSCRLAYTIRSCTVALQEVATLALQGTFYGEV